MNHKICLHKEIYLPNLKIIQSNLSDKKKRRQSLISNLKSTESYSLSHTETKSIIAIYEENYQLGADIELKRELSNRSRRYFLSTRELSKYKDINIIKLWTIKEAIFKAYKDNNMLGLLDFEIVSLEANKGKAINRNTQQQISFLFTEDNQYCLAIAFTKSIDNERRNMYA